MSWTNNQNARPKHVGDYDTDVLWKGPRMGNRMRTISTDSADSNISESSTPQRRFSIAGMFIGRQSSTEIPPTSPGFTAITERRVSVTENPDFKELLKRNRRILDQ
jgi:hypothetical protein